MKSRRHALTLAAALAATVLTGGAAILGLSHTPAAAPQATPAVLAQPAPSPQHWEEGD
ncbi:MAG TPA: hypothetical protein VMU58_13635 [Gaiellaceae bacterium]|nr:hypothetical protein [Gaiellaceae bacterium]